MKIVDLRNAERRCVRIYPFLDADQPLDDSEPDPYIEICDHDEITTLWLGDNLQYIARWEMKQFQEALNVAIQIAETGEIPARESETEDAIQSDQ